MFNTQLQLELANTSGKYPPPVVIVDNSKKKEYWHLCWVEQHEGEEPVVHIQVFNDKKLAKSVGSSYIKQDAINKVYIAKVEN